MPKTALENGNAMLLYRALLDQVQASPKRGAAPRLDDAYLAELLTLAVPEAVPVNIASLAFELPQNLYNRSTFDVHEFMSHLPRCAPPYTRMLFEYRHPYTNDTIAALVATERLPNNHIVANVYSYFLSASGIVRGPVTSNAVLFYENGEIVTKQAPLVLSQPFSPIEIKQTVCKPFDVATPMHFARPLPIRLNPLDDDDTIIRPTPVEEGESSYDRATRFGLHVTATALFACAVCNCQNVTERHARLPRQQSRLRERRHLQEIVWKEAHVEPLPKPVRADDVASFLEALTYRLSGMQGGFRQFARESPYLGRYAGTYWFPSIDESVTDVPSYLRSTRNTRATTTGMP